MGLQLAVKLKAALKMRQGLMRYKIRRCRNPFGI
jgi:hypothetical protein